MFIIIKKDKAEGLTEKLHKIKKFTCEVMEELEMAAERSYREEDFHHDYSRHSGRMRDDDEDFDRDYSRGRSMRGGRGRY